jgi:hypothetical protein
MRRALIGFGAMAVVALVLLASLHDEGSSASPQRFSSPTGVASNATDRIRRTRARRAAARDAQRRLEGLRLPPGAKQVSTAPSGSGDALQSPFSEPATPNLIDLHAWWTVPGSPLEALSWIKKHPPSGSTLKFEGSSENHGVTTSWDIGFVWPPIKGIAEGRMLLVTATTGAENETALRVDAQAVWVVPRPSSERVPAGSQFLDLTVGRPGKPQRRLSVTDPSFVKKIVAAINDLPIVQPGFFSCPAGPITPPVAVRLVFRIASGGPALAEAEQQLPGGSPCQPMRLTIRGDREPSLEEGWRVMKRLRGLLRRAR